MLLELQAGERTEAVRRFVGDLRLKAGVETLIQEPRRELHLAVTKTYLGRSDAPVQLVVFIDYDCPFCRKLEPTLASMIQSGPLNRQLGITIKQMPLPIHKTAREAALAAICAAEQNKFALFHERLLADSDHSQRALLQLAKEAGLDVDELSKCITSEQATRQLEMDLADAKALGVEATPSLFVDGTRVEYSNGEDLVRQVSASVERRTKAVKAESTPGGQ